MPKFKRSAGVLLHPTSLPGPHGIGDLGAAATDFLTQLNKSGLSWWQMLPITPPGFGESPYNSLSAFAGNPLLISLEGLVEDGFLSASQIAAPPPFPQDRVDFSWVKHFKEPLFRLAFEKFLASPKSKSILETTIQDNVFWLPDFTLYMAIKSTQEQRSWIDWPERLRQREPLEIERARRELKNEIHYHSFLQWAFERQWTSFRKLARTQRVQLMGDIPIFVAHDSADVWANPSLFKLNDNGHPTVVAGVPPDYFSPTGQRWGNPVYNWAAHKKNDFTWWIQRVARTLKFFDAVRLDHFIGFYRTWEINAGESTAVNGHWSPGPRSLLFEALNQTLKNPPLIAEDLGAVIPPIHRLRNKYELPGMFVLHFAFGDGFDAAQKRLKKIKPNTVVYTGTHDNDTTRGWFTSQGGGTPDMKPELITALDILRFDGRDIPWDLIRLALSLPADLAIVPCQDVLGLDTSARMNRPGTSEGNWNWRMAPNLWTHELSSKLHTDVTHHDRLA